MCRPFCVRGAHGNGLSGVVTAAFGGVGINLAFRQDYFSPVRRR